MPPLGLKYVDWVWPQRAFIIASDRFKANTIAFMNTRKIISVRLSENPVFGKL